MVRVDGVSECLAERLADQCRVPSMEKHDTD